MDTRYLLIGSAAVALAGAAVAAPLKPQPAPTNAPSHQVAEVVLASAEQVQTPNAVADAPAATPVKRKRAARVTTCRCAGQTPAADQADQ